MVPGACDPANAPQSSVVRISSPSAGTEDQDFLGLRILHEPKENAVMPNQKTVEIIFVHGLGGSAIGTWSHGRTKGFWLTWLAEEHGFANARIGTFGYDSNFSATTTGNCMGIPGFVDQLLDEINLHYYRQKDQVVVLGARH